MRYGLLVLGIAGCVALSLGWLARACDHAISGALTEEARIAMELGCQGRDGRAARECRSMLKKLYLSGSLDPDKTLRSYCDSVKNSRWGGSRPAPPEVCEQRYGGWPEG
jgi:hypothetical protein